MGVSMAIALAVLAIGFSAVVADAAPGLEPGVHADPGSPAAKEYALPLNQARQAGSARKGGSSRVAPFGAGIHPSGGSGSGSAGKSPRHRAGGKGTSLPAASNVSGSSTRAIIPTAVLRAASERGSSGGGGSILVLIGGGVAILVLGGFGGMVMRRSHRATPLA